MIGRRISHYRIIEELGRGGMGVVYKAEDEILKRPVALKFLTTKTGAVSEQMEELIQEARTTAALDHPNICPVYEIDEADGQVFIAMACIEGEALTERISSRRFSVEEAIDIAVQVAKGLDEAHRKGIIHRDVKPGNIMVSPNGQVRVTDFGVAKSFEPLRPAESETTSGTTSYMSPEQLRGEGADFRSDVWALGVVLYEMLGGARPFEGDYDQAVVYGVLNLEPTPLTARREEVPEDVAHLVSKALAKDPGGRFRSAGEMLAALEEAAEAGTRAGQRLAVAVISFENLTGQDEFGYLERAIPNLLITGLEQSQHLRVVTWERMRDLARQLGREGDETIDRDLGFEICKHEGIRAIVLGTFTKAGEAFATDAKVLDVDGKSLLASASARGEGVDSILRTQIDELCTQILAGLEVPERAPDEERPPIAEATTPSMEAYRLFLLGRDRFERLYNADARGFLEEATTVDPEFAAAYLYLGRVYRRMREARASREALERAKQLSARASRREMLYIEAGYARAVEQDPEREFRILRKIAAEYPDEKRVHHRLAGYYRARGRFYLAVEEYKKVLELDPSYGWAMNELAYMYTDVEDYERAAEYFERYRLLSPGDANPVDSQGELCFRMGRLDEALAKYGDALRLKPDFYYAYWEIAYVSALKEDYPQALEWIGAFVDKAPSFGTRMEGHRWRCFYLSWLGRHEEALKEARLISEWASEEGSLLWNAEASRMKGWISLARGELRESRSLFEACLDAIDQSPAEFVPVATSYSSGSLEQIPAQRAAHLFALALLDLNQQDVPTAEERLDEIARVAPDRAELLRAEILLAEGEAERATMVCEQAQAWRIPYMSDTEGLLLYNLPPLKDVLARALRAQGEVYRAVAEYERLTTVDHTTRDRRLVHPAYRFRLAELYEQKGWQEKARSEYRRFLVACAHADDGWSDVTEARRRLEALGAGFE